MNFQSENKISYICEMGKFNLNIEKKSVNCNLRFPMPKPNCLTDSSASYERNSSISRFDLTFSIFWILWHFRRNFRPHRVGLLKKVWSDCWCNRPMRQCNCSFFPRFSAPKSFFLVTHNKVAKIKEILVNSGSESGLN